VGGWDRLTLVLDVVLGLVLALMAVGVAVHPGWAATPPWGHRLTYAARWGLGAVGVVWALLSVRLLAVAFGRGARAPMVHQTDLGEVRVSISAMENLVLKVVHATRGMHDARVSAAVAPGGGLMVRVRAWVGTDVSVPAVSEDLQKSIRAYLKSVVGVETKEVHLVVEEITDARRGRVS
jgi:hypothetical protein